MGQGLIDGTLPLTQIDLTLFGGSISPSATRGLATGYVATSSTSGVAIRATTYSPQGTNAQRSVASSSANDSASGTGAQQITITCLNTTWTVQTEVITLNGTTAVATVNTDYAFVEQMVVTQTGTQGGGNIGTISFYVNSTGGGGVWASIAASDNRTFYAHHYIPAGVTCYIHAFYGGATAVDGSITIERSGNPLTVTSPQSNVAGSYPHGGPGNVVTQFRLPITVPGPDFVWLVERPVAATSSTTYGTFEYFQF